MIERTENVKGKSGWSAPETGPDRIGQRLSGQNALFDGQFHDTVSERPVGRGRFDGFFMGERWSSGQTLQDLECGAGQDAKHQVAHDLGGSSNPDEQRAKVVLELGVNPLGGGALLEPASLCGCQGDFLTAPRVGINDGDMAELTGEGVDLLGIVGGVHQIVEAGHALGGHLRQGDRDLGVMKGGGSEDGADGDVPIDAGQVQFVADPGFLMPLAVAFASDIAGGRQIGEIPGQCAQGLQFQTPGFFRSWGRVALRAAALGFGLG